MKRNSNKSRPSRTTLPAWTWTRAVAASPYIASIVRSIREHALAAGQHKQNLKRIDALPGRPTRDLLIEQQNTQRNLRHAEDALREATDELEKLEIVSFDSVGGQALVPFVHDNQLAWYIYDLFDEQPYRFWRYQSDPSEMRRPVTKSQQAGVR